MRKNLLLLLSLFFAITAWGRPTSDLTLYVNAAKTSSWLFNGTTPIAATGDGSQSNPYATIQEAYRAAWETPGDHEIRLLPGTYEYEDIGANGFASYLTGIIAFTRPTSIGGFETPCLWNSATLVADQGPGTVHIIYNFQLGNTTSSTERDAFEQYATAGGSKPPIGLFNITGNYSSPDMRIEDLDITIKPGGLLIGRALAGTVLQYTFNNVNLYLESNSTYGNAAIVMHHSTGVNSSSIIFKNSNIYYDPGSSNALFAGQSWWGGGACSTTVFPDNLINGDNTSRIYYWDGSAYVLKGNLTTGIWESRRNIPSTCGGGTGLQSLSLKWNENGTNTDGNIFLKDFITTPPPVKVYADATTTTVQSAHGTIQDAIDAATTNSGNVIRVDQGTYNELIDFTKDNLTLISNNGAANTTISGTAGTNEAGALVRFSANGCTIDGFTLDHLNSTQSAARIIGAKSSTGTTVQNCTLQNSPRAFGADWYGSPTNITFTNNTFSNVTRAISNTENVNGITITNNTFTNVGNGIRLASVSGTVTVTGNNFTNVPTGYYYKVTAASATNSYASLSDIITNNTFLQNASFADVAGGSYVDGIFGTITEAVEDAEVGATIVVAAGTYDGFRVTGKTNLTVQASGVVTITPVNISGETAGVYVDPGTTGLIIDGFSFDGTGLTNSRGVIGRDGSGYEVKNSSFANLATGVYANGTGIGNVSLTVKNSTFTNCSAGVGGTEATNPAIITGNTFTIPTNGEGVGLGTGVGGLTLNDNSFLPNTAVAIANYTTTTYSATCNWFGQASGPAAGQISGNVTTIPFLTNGNDSDGSTPGFQPAAGSCVGGPVKVYADATTTTVQSAHATIQDAIDAATTINSNVIRVDAGTYNETLNISKSVAVISDATPTTDAIIRGGGGTGAADAVVRFSANDATLEGFTIDRNDAAGNNRAIAPMASSGTTIKDNTIINAFRGIQGDFYGSPTNLTISGNTFSGSVSYGISGTENMNGLTITGNTFTDNTEGIGLGTGLTNLSITGNNSFTSTDPTTKHIAAYGSNLMPDISALYTNNTFGAAFSVNPTNGTDGTTAAIYNSLATSLANTSTDVTTQSTLQIPDNTSISGDLDLSGTPGNDPAVNLSPGNSPGCITIGGNISITSNDQITIEVDGTTACTEYDQISLTGDLTLGNATLNLVLGYDPAHNASFTILKNDGLNAVNGTFGGLAEGALFTANYNGAAYTLSISYEGGDGNDVVVTALTRVRVYNATNALVSTHNDIQPAIIAPTTMDGYSITLEAGTYYGNVFSSGEVIISKEVAIKGANTGTSGNAARVAESELVGFFQVLRNNVTIDGLKISSLGTALVNDNSNAYQAYLNGATSYFNNISFINNIVTGKDGSSAVVQLDKASNPNQATLASSDWNVSDNRFESFEGTTGNTVISVKGISGITINNNVIQYNATDATTSTNALDGRKGIDVDFVEQTGKTIQITGNTIALNADVSDPATRDAELAKAPFGIRVLGDIKDITLSSNTISKTQDGIIVEKNGSGSNQISNGTLNSNAITDINNGISVTAGSLLNVSGTSNSVEAFKSAIVLDVDAGTFTNVQLIENKLVSGATFYGLQAITSNTTTDQILSRCNWYGAADFATVTAKNNGPIDFTQFATDGDLANLKCGKVLDEISAFLEGPFDITTGSMKTLLNTPQAPVIPIFPSQPSVLETHGLTQPYGAAPFSYAGTETTTAQYLTDNDSIVDWVLIETRDVTDRTVVLERKAAFICAKGRIISHDGNPIVMETGGSPTFHIALWHRNHTNIATKDPVPGKWDIRESSANVYEQTISVGPITQTLKTLKTQGFYKVIYGGDGNNDNSITSTDFNAWIQAAGQNGYFIGDFDLNGNVTTSDLNLPVGNIGQDISFPQ